MLPPRPVLSQPVSLPPVFPSLSDHPHDFQNDLRWRTSSPTCSLSPAESKTTLHMPSRPWALGRHPTFHATSPFPVLEKLGDLGPEVAKLVQARPAVRQVHLEPEGLRSHSGQTWDLLPASDIKSPSQLGQSMLFRFWSGQLIYYRKSPAKD